MTLFQDLKKVFSMTCELNLIGYYYNYYLTKSVYLF
jgi:hypothetical protein